MPQVANYAGVGTPKPGAVVLMNVAEPNHRPSPLLTIQNFGHGRVGVFATAGSWRWRMLQDHTDYDARDFLAATDALDGDGHAGTSAVFHAASGAVRRHSCSVSGKCPRQDLSTGIRSHRADDDRKARMAVRIRWI